MEITNIAEAKPTFGSNGGETADIVEGNGNRFQNLCPGDLMEQEQQAVVDLAMGVLSERCCKGAKIDSPESATEYARLRLADEKDEVFALMYLNNQNQVLEFEPLFRGNLKEAPVYPRVIARRALETNASAMIAFHNHPSGNCKPSQADRKITGQIVKVLKLLDMKLLDHIVVSQTGSRSFAEEGLLDG